MNLFEIAKILLKTEMHFLLLFEGVDYVGEKLPEGVLLCALAGVSTQG